MLTLSSEFATGVLRKAAILTGLVASLVWGFFGFESALSYACGALSMVVNAAGIWWMMQRVMKPGRGSGFWTVLFLGKLLVLFVVTYYLIAVLGLGAFEFVMGYASLLAVMAWQALEKPG